MADNGEPSTARLLAYVMIDGMPALATNEDKCLRLSVCGFSNPEIGEILGISPGSVKTNLYEARKKLATSGRDVSKQGRPSTRKAAKKT